MARLRDFSDRLGRAIRGHQRLFVAAVVALSVLMWLSAATAAWFVGVVVTGLPGEKALNNVAMMERSTMLLDVRDRPAFTSTRSTIDGARPDATRRRQRLKRCKER